MNFSKPKVRNWQIAWCEVKSRELKRKKRSTNDKNHIYEIINNLSRIFCSYAIQSELLALRRAHLEISHQLETANEEVRALSLRLQENVS